MSSIINKHSDPKFNGKFRHEYKYICSDSQLELLKHRIDGLISLDKHVKKSGMYNIRSAYFDDYFDTCLKENIAGTDPREKFRIRIYNYSDERISLELKKKVNGKTQKHSCSLTRSQCDLLLAGTPLPISNEYPPVLQKLCLQMRMRGLKPVVIVEYDRVPYVLKEGNVRITLDLNICSSNEINRFFDADIGKRPVMPIGKQVLEVKWDEFLPDVLYQKLQLDNLQRTAFSKYQMCRQYSLLGGR